MSALRWIQMTETEIGDFLGTGGTGVMSFRTAEGPPVSIPLSYGYFAEEEAFYFQLSLTEESEKQPLTDNEVSYVVYEQTDAGWHSVIATGTLENITESPYESGAVQGMWAVKIPYVEIFERPRREVSFENFRLVPDRLTGRKEGPT